MLSTSLIFALLIGLSLGILGGGGSTLAVPVFIYIAKYDTKTAICMSLLVVGTASLFGSFRYWKNGEINPKIAMIFGPFAMLGAYIGSKYISPYFTDDQQLILFASMMIIASFVMFIDKKQNEEENKNYKKRYDIFAPQGLFIGILSGLVGVGGGFLIIPSLIIFGKLHMREAVGTSLIIIAMNATTGVAGYLSDVNIPWVFTFWFTGFAIIGIYAGTSFAKHIPQQKLKKGFAVFILLMGTFVMYTKF